MSKLLPCPFCGGEAEIVQCDDEGNVRGEEYESNPWSGLGYRVVHESDDCPIFTGEDGYNLIYDSREEAESHWNRRADECDRDSLIDLAKDLDDVQRGLVTGKYMTPMDAANRIRKALGVESWKN